jgi:hypothetical protein
MHHQFITGVTALSQGGNFNVLRAGPSLVFSRQKGARVVLAPTDRAALDLWVIVLRNTVVSEKIVN